MNIKNILFGLVVIFLFIKFVLSPVISSLMLIISFNKKKQKIGKKIEDVDPVELKNPMGNFILFVSIICAGIAMILSFFENWLFALILIPISLNFLLIKIQNNRCYQSLGLYDGGLVTPSRIVLWTEIHSYFLENDMVCFYLENGMLYEYKINKTLVNKFEKEEIMLNTQ